MHCKSFGSKKGGGAIPWDDEQQLISLGREFIQFRQQLQDKHHIELRSPLIQSELAARFRLTAEELADLEYFAENDLGWFERDFIFSQASEFYTIEGKRVDRDKYQL